jgi:hypothetical protein
MKKIVMMMALVALCATTAYAGLNARTGVNGSQHDMNTFGGGTDDVYGRVCVFCHTPHNADITVAEAAPLWNHEQSAVEFLPYEWATPENIPLVIADPMVGPSRLCLSCHDGVVAVDQHGPSVPFAGSAGGVLAGGRGDIGNSGDLFGLTDDHPIGFSYVDAVTERNTADLLEGEVVPVNEFFATDIDTNQAGGTYNLVTRAGGRMIQDVLYGGEIMTCASCHEVHNKENVVQLIGTNGITPNYFLYAQEDQSLICLSCHIK